MSKRGEVEEGAQHIKMEGNSGDTQITPCHDGGGPDFSRLYLIVIDRCLARSRSQNHKDSCK